MACLLLFRGRLHWDRHEHEGSNVWYMCIYIYVLWCVAWRWSTAEPEVLAAAYTVNNSTTAVPTIRAVLCESQNVSSDAGDLSIIAQWVWEDNPRPCASHWGCIVHLLLTSSGGVCFVSLRKKYSQESIYWYLDGEFENGLRGEGGGRYALLVGLLLSIDVRIWNQQ